jgi:hypothetical protein
MLVLFKLCISCYTKGILMRFDEYIFLLTAYVLSIFCSIFFAKEKREKEYLKRKLRAHLARKIGK